MFFVHRCTARLSRLLYFTMIHFACIAARLNFESFLFYVQLKLYLLSCTDPHSFVRDRGAFEESIAWQNGSQSGVWSWPDQPSHNFASHGNNLFQLIGGQGGAITLFSLPSPAEYFSYFEGGGEAMHLLSHPTCFPIVPREGSLDFLGLFLWGGGLGGICSIPQLLAGLAKNLFLLERVERGAIVLYTSLIFPKFPVNS